MGVALRDRSLLLPLVVPQHGQEVPAAAAVFSVDPAGYPLPWTATTMTPLRGNSTRVIGVA